MKEHERDFLKGMAAGRLLCLAASFAALSTSAVAADIYWIGGTGSKTWNTAANWDLGRVPAWGDTVYITNAVSLSLTSIAADSIRVSGGNVSIATGSARYMPGSAISSTVEIWVDSGRTLTWSGDYLIYGNTGKTFVKSGGGTLTISVGIGNDGNRFKSVEVREGVLNHTTQYNAMVTSSGVLKIGASGTYKINPASSQTISSQTVSSGMVVDIAEGGALDLCNNNNARTLRGLTGGGKVINNKSGLKLRGEGLAASSSGTFAGQLSGTVTIEPQNGNAFIVGAADTLSNCTLNVTWPATGKIPLKFAAGIGSFFVKAIPDVDAHVDVAGEPIKFILPGSGRDWYVDPSRETSGDGTSLATAFKAFTNAFDVAASGDTVWAAPGTYSAETVKDSEGLDCRLSIPAGVKVRATGSATDTIIDGGGTARCVCMQSGSHLSGFTVQNGFAGSGKSGGGVYAAPSEAAYVVDCVIKNNKAGYRSGEVKGSGLVFYRCKFLGNSQNTPGQGTEAIDSLWSCYVNGYTLNAFWYGGSAGTFRNCTFGESLSSNLGGLRTNSGAAHYYNGICLASTPGTAANSQKVNYHNSLLTAPSSKTNSIVNCDAACKFSVSKASILDSSYKPIATGVAVDTGTNSYYSLPAVLSRTYGDTDLAGAPRKMNGAIDIGAYEYDWRPVFGNALAKGLVIDDMTSGVTTNETGLSMSTNDRIVLRLGRDRDEVGTYSFSASVDGGSLHVYDGGTNLVYEIDSAAATDTYTVETDKALSLTFVFRGVGMASLSNFRKPQQGLMFFFR